MLFLFYWKSGWPHKENIKLYFFKSGKKKAVPNLEKLKDGPVLVSNSCFSFVSIFNESVRIYFLVLNRR